MAIQVDPISVEGHLRKQYSSEEQAELKYKFVVTLHFLLIIYLTLHNLLIPLSINLARGNFLFTDVHFWFLIHLPIHYVLKKKGKVDETLYSAVAFGVFLRTITEMILVSKFKSWGMISIFISEIASLIIVVVIYSVYKPRFRWQGFLIALIFIPVLSHLEVRSEWSKQSIVKEKSPLVADNNFGCEGSLIEFSNKTVFDHLKPKVDITTCGLSQKMAKSSDQFKILNTKKTRINIRLFKLHISNGVPRWRFVRLYVIGPSEELILPADLLSKERLFLLKSPEMRELGQTLIVNTNRVSELLKGDYQLDSVSMHFTPEENE